jgi:uncharacterized protein
MGRHGPTTTAAVSSRKFDNTHNGKELQSMLTICLLLLSNVFMTIAWYGHLKFKESPLWIVILVSWGIALVEYCLQVPANRWGHGTFTAPQLKIIQEVLTLVVFAVFSGLVLREPLRWNDYAGFGLILAAVVVVFAGRSPEPQGPPTAAISSSTSLSADE